jgi:type I restriction enzyme S subunit
MGFEFFRLGDVAEIVGGGTPPTKESSFWNGEISWITPKDLSDFDGVYISVGGRSITEEGLAASSARLLPPRTVLYTSRAPIGYVAIAEESVATNQGFKSLVLKDGFSPEYMFYLLKASKNEILSHSSGGTFAEISASAMREVRLQFPELNVQESIARVLLSLDSKIQVNKLISKTLEAIAQTLFRSWFVDFDPVRAKMAGGKPVGMDDATAALFPDSMEDSELGLIPQGWTLEKIGDVLDVVGGGTPSTGNDDFWNGDICWTTPKDLSNQQGLITTTSARMITKTGLAKISSGLLSSHSVLMSCRAPIGYIAVNAVPTAVNQGFIAIRDSELYSPLYLVNWLKANMPEIKNRAGGATFAEITRKAFREIPFLAPNAALIEKFSSIVTPMLLSLEAMTMESESVVALRDSILPRLISGELEVPEDLLVS